MGRHRDSEGAQTEPRERYLKSTGHGTFKKSESERQRQRSQQAADVLVPEYFMLLNSSSSYSFEVSLGHIHKILASVGCPVLKAATSHAELTRGTGPPGGDILICC